MYTYTHKPSLAHRVLCAIVAHSVAIEAVVLSIGLNVVMGITDTPYQAHYMMRVKKGEIHGPVAATKTILTLTQRAQLRKKEREARIVRTQLTVVSLEQPFIAEEMRPAAPVIEVVTPSSLSSSSSESSESSLSSFSSSSSHSSQSSSSSLSSFPAFGNAIHPVARVPNWGAMTSPAEWNRSYRELTKDDFVAIPSYNLSTLTTPMSLLEATRHDPKTIDILTAKLYYSTRYFGAYDLDASEFSAVHPGIDLKLAEGTPIAAVAGGRVHDVRRNEETVGLHVIIEHRAPDGTTYYSIYGHLASTSVQTGEDVTSGKIIGTVGMTGQTTGAHLHLQIDRGEPNEINHRIYWPDHLPSALEANARTINPITFIRTY